MDPAEGSSGPTAPGRLDGVRVVVTRARTQASGLVERLVGLGARVVELPVIAVQDPADGGAALSAAMERVVSGGYDWVVVTSANGARRAVDALDGRVPPGSTRWAAVGTSTARVLEDRGIVPDLVPGAAVSDALVESFPSVPSDRAGTVLFVRAEQVRGVVAPGLEAKGWVVDEAVAYRTVAGDVGPDAIAEALAADAIAFTSSSTVERTIDLLGSGGVPAVVVSIGPVTSGSARAAGLEVTVEATEHTLDGLVEAMIVALSGAASGVSAPAGPVQERPTPSA